MSEQVLFPTRQSVIVHHTRMMLAQTSCTLISFTKNLVLNYHSMVPEHGRTLSLRTWRERAEDERDNVLEANRKIVQRYMDDTVHFPAELEEAWVMSLAEGYQEQCTFDLMFRYGRIPVPVLRNVSLDDLSVMMKEHAEALAALAPMLSDGRINETDAPFAIEAYRELVESISATAAVAEAIKAQFPKLIQSTPEAVK